MTDTAVFLAGNFKANLEEICEAQSQNPDVICWIQPAVDSPIAYLRANNPSEDDPVILYASVSDDLEHVHFTAEIVGWHDKRKITTEKLEAIKRKSKELQPSEQDAFDRGVNLIAVRRMRQVKPLLPVCKLTKVRDGTPLRSMRSRWSYVAPLPDDPAAAER